MGTPVTEGIMAGGGGDVLTQDIQCKKNANNPRKVNSQTDINTNI